MTSVTTVPMLTGGQALIRTLEQAGVHLVTGVPGAGQYEAVDPLYDSPIRYVSVRHEQAASYIADGYARISGAPAAVVVLPGPGLLNAGAGIATAYACSSPMLVITGEDILSARGLNGDNVWPPLQSLTKWSARVTHAADVPAKVVEALQQTLSGRRRPVGLEIPHAVLAAQADIDLRTVPPITPHEPDPAALEEAVACLHNAQHPLIWAGSGVLAAGAWTQLQALAERLNAPVVTTRSGKGALSDRHPLAVGFAELRDAALRRFVETRDVILAVGLSQDLSRLSVQIVRVDIDPVVATNAATVSICADARATLVAILAALPELDNAVSTVAQEVTMLRAERFNPTRQLQPQWDLMQAIRTALPDDAILVQDMNQMGYYSRNYWATFAPRSYLTSSRLATLGGGWPMALGAQLAAPDRVTVALCGDGGFLYNAQELATAVQEHIPAIAVVFNDQAYGNVLRAQQEQFNNRVIGTRLQSPDFVALGQSYGAWAVRAEGPLALHDALIAAIEIRRPALIEVPVGPMQRVF